MSNHRNVTGRHAVLIALLAAWCVCSFTPSTHAQNQLSSLGDIVPSTQLDTSVSDLVRIATGYGDALRELKVARLSLQTVQSLRPNAVVTNLEVQIAALNLQAAEQKVKILRSIVEKQLAAAEDKLAIVRYLEKNFDLNGQGEQEPKINQRSYARVQDEATVEILKMILAMK